MRCSLAASTLANEKARTLADRRPSAEFSHGLTQKLFSIFDCPSKAGMRCGAGI
jgi:hypothetical protein